MNRDYFHRPVQSDRTSYGYGHTELDDTPDDTHWSTRYQTPLAMLVVFAAAIACVSL